MLGALAKKVFGSSNDRRVKAFRPRVEAINAMEQELEGLSDEALRARKFRLERVRAGAQGLVGQGFKLLLHGVDGIDPRSIGPHAAVIGGAENFLCESAEHLKPVV